MMNIKFLIDETYLIVHTLASLSEQSFSSEKEKRTITAFQNIAWKKSSEMYNLVIGRIKPPLPGSKTVGKKVENFFESLKKDKNYKKILADVYAYKKFCEDEWRWNIRNSSAIIKELTGFNLDKKFTVYLTHPSLKNGWYRGNNVISWGHHEDWENYTVVYLWHEILHSYFNFDSLHHAVIELIVDNELRIRLNGGTYPPFKGHQDPDHIKKHILSQWRKYLLGKNKNIRSFMKKLEKKHIVKRSSYESLD